MVNWDGMKGSTQRCTRGLYSPSLPRCSRAPWSMKRYENQKLWRRKVALAIAPPPHSSVVRLWPQMLFCCLLGIRSHSRVIATRMHRECVQVMLRCLFVRSGFTARKLNNLAAFPRQECCILIRENTAILIALEIRQALHGMHPSQSRPSPLTQITPAIMCVCCCATHCL